MAIKVFLDINIIIDLLDAKRPEHFAAVNIFKLSEDGEIQAFVSESVLNTTIYILRKIFTPDKMKLMLNHLLTFTNIIPCTNKIYRESLQLSANDLEDAVLYQLAFDQQLDYFVTSDKKDFRKMSSVLLPVVNGRELLKSLHVD